MENLIVFCFSCNNYYPAEQVVEIKADRYDTKRYLCSACLDNMPEGGAA